MKTSKRTLMVALAMMTLMVTPAASIALEAGDKAPLFTAESTQGAIQLAERLGKKNVVLALYFAVFTPV